MSVLGNTLGVLSELGLYDVVLPFLLIFTLIFAILEKTKILGEEEIDGKKYTKKNLNAMISFVIALITVAIGQAVGFINKFLGLAVVVIVILFGFLLMIGIFFNTSERNKPLIEYGWVKAFTVLVFIATIFIILAAADVLDNIYDFISSHMQGSGMFLGPFLMIVIFGLIIFFIVRPSKPLSPTKEE